MKYLILVLLIISCKPKDVNPCYLITVTEVTVYYESAGDIFWDTEGKPVTKKLDVLVCNESYENYNIKDLLNGLVIEKEKTKEKCVTIHLVAIKQKRT